MTSMPRRASLVALAGVLMVPLAARGQATTLDHPVAGGVRAGVTTSSWIGSGDASLHVGLALAGFVSVRLTPRFAIQPELVMHDKGADFRDAAGMVADEALLVLELPVLARLDQPLGELVSLYGVAGPGISYLVDSKRTPRQDLAPIDVTLTVGLGVDLYTPTHYLSIDLRTGIGLIDLRDDPRSARAFFVELLGGVTL
jgi:hypothetical protein